MPGEEGFLTNKSILDFFKASPKGIEEGRTNPLCNQPSTEENGQIENIEVKVGQEHFLHTARKKRKVDDIDEDITESEVEKKTPIKEGKDERGKKQKLTKNDGKVDNFDDKKSELGVESIQQETIILNETDDRSKGSEDSIICLSDSSFNDTLDAAAKHSQVSVYGPKIETVKVMQGLESSNELHIKEGKSNFNSEEEQDEDKVIDLSNSDISLPDCRGENGDQLVLISSTPVRHRKTDSVSIGSSKKNLKGKDMLNLLKEIQKDGENEKSKGKKKKQNKNSASCSENSATNWEPSTEMLTEESTSDSWKHENKEHASNSKNSTAEHTVSMKNTGRDKMKTVDDEVVNIEEGNVMQLSFSEYLDSISCKQSGTDQDLRQGQDEDSNSTLLRKTNIMENKKTTKNSTSETNETETSIMLEKDNDKKNPSSKTGHVGIAKFFTKSSTPFKRNEEVNSLTVEAVVHPEPSPPKREVASIDQTSYHKGSGKTDETMLLKRDGTRGRKRQKDDRIEFLSTEIISTDEIDPGKKTVDLDKSHSDDIRAQDKTENTDNTTKIKEKEDSLTENLSEAQKEENERKITFLKSSPKPSIPEKTSQPTLCFGKSGLTLTKPSSTHTTRVRKPHDNEEETEKDRKAEMGTDKTRDMTPAKKGKSESQFSNKRKKPEGKTSSSKDEGHEKALGNKKGVESETDTNDNQDEENLAQSNKVFKKDKTGIISKTSTPGRPGRGRKPSSTQCDKNTDSLIETSNVEIVDLKASTPRRSRRGRKPLTAKDDDSIDDVTEVADVETMDVEMAECEQGTPISKPNNLDTSGVTEDEISERRQSLRKRYMVTGFQMDEEKKTPIKIKLKRYAKSSSSGEDSMFTPNSAKRGIKTKREVDADDDTNDIPFLDLVRRVRSEFSACDVIDIDISEPAEDNSNEWVAALVESYRSGNVTTAKQTQAQKLLEKAKQHKSGMKSRETKISKPKGTNSIKKNRDNFSRKGSDKSSKTIEDNTGRKSARLANKPKISMEELVILEIESESEEGDGEETKEPIKKKQGKKNTAKPSSPKKPGTQKSPKKCGTPRKSDLKLAPIFNKKLPGEKNMQEVPPIDPEKLRLRNEFLHCGLPEDLKKQSAIHTAVLTTDYPPFPRPNHVQQILDWSKEEAVQSQDTNGLHVWDLPKVNLKFNDYADTAPEIKSTSKSLNTYRNVETIFDLSVIKFVKGNNELIVTDQFKSSRRRDFFERISVPLGKSTSKNFSGHLELKVEHLEACLAEVQSFNPSCPVKRMYSVLKKMKSKSVNSTQATGQSVLLEAHEGSSLTRQHSNESDIIADETANSKTTRKRCTRLSSSKEKQIESHDSADVGNGEASKEEDKDKLTTVTLPWTEKYQPCKALDILGNSSNIKRLKFWLTEWKQRVDRETRKAKKLLMKQSKGKKTSEETAEAEKDDLWGDDSDFDLDSEDSEEEDNSLCNTMLITGPHGIGKTASVYALAQELGFKVFEVNASSSRSGKKILSQLQEATQSHQVSHNKEIGTQVKSALPAMNVDSEPLSKGVGTKHSAPTTKIPSVFANFFKKEAPIAPTSSQQSTKKPASAAQASSQGRKRCRDKIDSEEAPQQKRIKKGNSSPIKAMGTAGKKKKDNVMGPILDPVLGTKGLNLTSTSLILFDEVDVVFEEDKGFLAAIQTFMNSTKIPIIMITAQTSFASQFEGRFEELIFKPPSLLSITSHLQVMCLVENLRTDFEDLFRAVQFNSGDIRRCMHALQFWVESGGGVLQCNRSIKVSGQPSPAVSLQINNESQDTLLEDSQAQELEGITSDLDYDDDFVIAKPVRIRSRRLIDEDQSNSLDGVAAFNKLIAEKTCSESQQAEGKAEEEEKDLPKVHSLVVDSQITTSNLIKKSLCSAIKTSLQTFPTSNLLELCARYKENRCEVLYSNVTQLLSLPIVDSVAPCMPKSETPDNRKPKRRRIKSDLFDSEGSDEETHQIQGSDNDASNNLASSSNATQDNQATNVKQDESEKSFGNHIQKSLQYFADYYDTMSLLDIMDAQMECKDLNQPRLVNRSRCRLLDGIDDIPSNFEQQRKGSISQHQLGSELEVRSFHRFYCEIDSIHKKLGDLCENSPAKEAMTLPVMKGQDKFAVSVSPIGASSLESRIPSSINRCVDNVLNNLPLTVHNHHSDLSLDYLPLLQVICRSEQCRHLAKMKRRFHHYLDSIGMPLKESTLNVLASSFS